MVSRRVIRALAGLGVLHVPGQASAVVGRLADLYAFLVGKEFAVSTRSILRLALVLCRFVAQGKYSLLVRFLTRLRCTRRNTSYPCTVGYCERCTRGRGRSQVCSMAAGIIRAAIDEMAGRCNTCGEDEGR